MTSWGSISYAFGPLVAVAGPLLTIWLLRRTFRRNERAALPDDVVFAPLLGPHTWLEVNRVARLLDRVGIAHRVVDHRTSYELQVPADDLAQARAVMHAGFSPGGS